jgi:voltage-gated potassium channel
MARRWMTRHGAGCSRSIRGKSMRHPGQLRAWQYRLPRRFILMVVVPFLLVLGGTFGFYGIENWMGRERWSMLDALYMTVITLSTIGYGETHPLSDPGRLFAIALILGGVFTFLYTATEIIRSVVSGEVAEMLGKQQREHALADASGHIIVCGYGRMGRLVCSEFSRDGVPFVLVDVNEEEMRDFDLPHGLTLVGDATSDDVLKRAGIDRARGLVTVMASDADNLFATLSARLLRADLFIVARSEAVGTEAKLVRAGANRVVSPYQIGGTRVAQAVLRPTVVDFIELATRTEHIDLQLEETCVAANSALAGASLKSSRVRADLKIIIVAIKKHGGHMHFNPASETVLEPGDTLVAMGNREHLSQLQKLANPQ